MGEATRAGFPLGFKKPQDALRHFQDWPKMLHETFKRPQDAPRVLKMAPRCSKTPPRCDFGGFGAAKWKPFGTKIKSKIDINSEGQKPTKR